MTTLREAAQQALLALDAGVRISPKSILHDWLRAALTQKQAETVREQTNGSWHDGVLEGHLRERERWMAQERAEPLTEEEILALAEKALKPSVYYDAEALLGTDGLVALARAVERAHGIIESEIREDIHQTLDDAMQQPRAMAQAYENGYKAGAAAERDKLEPGFKQLEALMQVRETQPNKPCCLTEREACARVCDDKAKETFSGQCQVWGDYFARAIRARSEK